MGSLTEFVKAQAVAQGFDLVGITRPVPPPHFSVFKEWLAAGHHGNMAYLARERSLRRRADPREILPECRSILVTGTFHPPPPSPDQIPPTQPQIAAYARGDDYHDLLPSRLENLMQIVEGEFGEAFPYRIYTDTGPLLERDLGMMAGLGWIGRNSCLIHPRYGSYFLLAEVLLGLPLEPDPPQQKDFCGTCRRCIDACPTGCIREDRTLDARRCISYLTIEEKGAIPHSLRTSIGNWMFGCDICQQVCPWNIHFQRATSDPDLQPRPELAAPVLDRFLSMEQVNWKDSVRASPLERPRRKGLVRNAAIVAGNLQDPSAIEPLIRLLLQDEEPLVRGHAAAALGRFADPRCRRALMHARPIERDPEVQVDIQTALDHTAD
jgi:epoxyqueuosine reductase